jgi:glucokinase
VEVGLYSIGVDLGGTSLRVAAYSREDGLNNVIQLSTRRPGGRDAVIVDLCEAVESLWLQFGGIERYIGIGVATPGPTELPDGRLSQSAQSPRVKKLSVGARTRKISQEAGHRRE